MAQQYQPKMAQYLLLQHEPKMTQQQQPKWHNNISLKWHNNNSLNGITILA